MKSPQSSLGNKKKKKTWRFERLLVGDNWATPSADQDHEMIKTQSSSRCVILVNIRALIFPFRAISVLCQRFAILPFSLSLLPWASNHCCPEPSPPTHTHTHTHAASTPKNNHAEMLPNTLKHPDQGFDSTTDVSIRSLHLKSDDPNKETLPRPRSGLRETLAVSGDL